jgi:hypothetical protein
LDLNKLSKGERTLGISALALLVLSFLPLWAKFEAPDEFFGGGSERYGAWSSAFGFLLKLALILTIIALVLVIMKAAGVAMSLPVPTWQIYAVAAGLTLLLLLITVLTGPRGDQGEVAGFEWSRGLAVFIAPLLGAGMAFGAFQHMSEEGSAPTTTAAPPSAPPPAS